MRTRGGQKKKKEKRSVLWSPPSSIYILNIRSPWKSFSCSLSLSLLYTFLFLSFSLSSPKILGCFRYYSADRRGGVCCVFSGCPFILKTLID